VYPKDLKSPAFRNVVLKALLSGTMKCSHKSFHNLASSFRRIPLFPCSSSNEEDSEIQTIKNTIVLDERNQVSESTVATSATPLYARGEEESVFLAACKNLGVREGVYEGVFFRESDVLSWFSLFHNGDGEGDSIQACDTCGCVRISEEDFSKVSPDRPKNMAIERKTGKLVPIADSDATFLLSAAAGDRRIVLATLVKQNSTVVPMKRALGGLTSIPFDTESLLKIRDIAVYSDIRSEISGFFKWDSDKNSFVSDLKQACVGKAGSEAAEVSMFYVEYHTHPLFAHLRGTDEVINAPSSSDLYSLQKEFIEGNVMAVVITMAGVFTTWLEPAFQKAILFSGKADVRLVCNEPEIEVPAMNTYKLVTGSSKLVGNKSGGRYIIHEAGTAKKNKSIPVKGMSKTTLPFGGGLWKIVHKTFQEYIKLYSHSVLGGPGKTICTDPDRVACFNVSPSKGKLTCIYKATDETIIDAKTYAAGMFKLTSLANLLKDDVGKDEWGAEKRDNIFKDAVETLKIIESTDDEDFVKSIPLVGSSFYSWREIESSKGGVVSLAPASVLENWLPPADRFVDADASCSEGVPTDSNKFVHLDSGRSVSFFRKETTDKSWKSCSKLLESGKIVTIPAEPFLPAGRDMTSEEVEIADRVYGKFLSETAKTIKNGTDGTDGRWIANLDTYLIGCGKSKSSTSGDLKESRFDKIISETKKDI